LFKKVRDYLLTQDHLYKDFVKMEKDFNTKRNEIELQLKNAREQILEE